MTHAFVCALALLALLALSAPAAMAAAPVPATGQPTAVTETTATLNGTVNPEGQDTSYVFQYGTTTAYGSQTPTTDAGPGTTTVNASAAISSLAPGTKYHYRLVATNASGTTPGSDRVFTTNSPPAPVVITRTANVRSATSATLRGIVNPRGESTSYFFQYGTTTAYGARTPTVGAGAGTTRVYALAAVSSLTPHTTYHYRLLAISPAGTTTGSDVSFTTDAGPGAVTITASPATIIFGQGTTISGRVQPPRAAHLSVTLQSAPSLAGPWVTHRGLTVNPDAQTGTYSFKKLSPSSNTYYRAVADGVSSPALHVLVRFRVAAFVDNKTPHQGSLVRFRGRVAPGHRGLRVWVKWLGPDRHWHIVGRTRLHGPDASHSVYSIQVRIEQGGLYRVVVKHDRDHAKGFSQIIRIRVH